MWDIQTGQQKACFLGHSYGIARLAWSPDGTTLASGGQDGTTRLWDIQQAETREQRLTGFVRRKFFSPDGKMLIVARQDGSLTLVEYPGLKPVRDLSGAGEPLGFLPDGRTLLTLQQRGNNPPRLVSWGIPNLDSLTNTLLPGVTNQIFASALSSDGNWLAIGLGKGEIGLWHLSRGRMSQVLSVPLPQISHAMTLAFSPDGRFLAGTFTDSTIIQLWDIPNSFQRTELGRQRGWIYHLLFTPDGRFLISADGEKFIKIWDLAERKEVTILLGHRNSILSLDISPDGRTLASASSDRTLRLWNLPTHREVARFELESPAYPIAFAPDGNALLHSSWYKDPQSTATIIWPAPALADTGAKH